MKQIPLTQGKYAIVDDEDFEYLNQWKWHINNSGYAMRTIHLGGGRKNEKKKNIFLHRLLMNPKNNESIDHVSGDPLDNRKINLRLCKHAQNMKNQKIRKDNTSGFKGVSFDKNHKKWVAYINVDRKRFRLGHFTIKELAAIAYDNKARELHGEYARLNFPL